MECPACGHRTSDNARFCEKCGVSLAQAATCPGCGAPTTAGQKFCHACGRRLAAPPPALRDRLAHTPGHLVEKIRTARPDVEGERKHVTVLVADVQGSMELASGLDPEEWRRIMDRFFAILCDGVHRFEGTVDKFTGDGIMALFGAPIAHEDHARRACYAALHLRDELTRYAGELRRTQGLSFSVRMGLNSGEVVVGTIGDDLSLKYTALGHTVGLAQRMEALGEPGKAYLTEHTAKLVRGYLELADLGRFEVTGVTEPVQVYELSGLGTLRTHLQVAAARGFSRFVGRDEEMATLEGLFAQATGGRPRVAGVVGEAGVGKSRLCYELAQRCRAEGAVVWEARGLAHAQTVPFVPVLDILRSYFGIAERDDDRTTREKVAGRLLLLDESFQDVLPLIFDFLGVPDPERPAPRIEGEARQRLLFATFDRLVHARGAQSASVVVVEDLQWLDPGSEAFLEKLVEALPGTRTLLLVNFRPEYRAGWMEGADYVQLALQPLGPEAIGQLLDDLLGTDRSLNGLAEMIRELTGGNPFFIEEVVQTLAESGTLDGPRGGYRLTKTIKTVRIPPTVQAVLASRIDRLDEREKSVLQTAAVIGKEFSEPVLRRVTGLPESELAATLRALVAAEFVYEQAVYPEAEYSFKHAITEEVAYRSQLTAPRARLHAAVARATKELYPDRLNELSALLAHHWEAARQPLRAARWSARAAGWAGFNSPFEALRHWRKVRELTEALEETPEAVRLAIMSRWMILNFAWRLGLSEGQDVMAFEDEIAELFAEGRSLAERHEQIPALASLISTYGAVRIMTGHLEDGVTLGTEAAELVEPIGISALQIGVRLELLYALFVLGRIHEALLATDEGLQLIGADPSASANVAVTSPYAFLLMARGHGFAWTGRLGEGQRALDHALRAARKDGDVETETWTHAWIVSAADLSGETEHALAHARQACEIAERAGGAFSRGLARHSLGRAHILRGEWAEAIGSLERALAIWGERHVGLEWEPLTLAMLARAYLGGGDAPTAAMVAEEAIRLAAQRGARLWELVARREFARALLGRDGAGGADAAEEELGRSLDLVAETGATSYEPHVRLTLADVARVRGDEPARERELREAERQFMLVGADSSAVRSASAVG